MESSPVMELLFWIAVFGVVYPYAGYPLALYVLGRLIRTRPVPEADLPSVSMIMPVHNEAARIEAKVRNTLALDYPADRLQVLFVSDGSTDQTIEIINATKR